MKFYKFLFTFLLLIATTTHGYVMPRNIVAEGDMYELKPEFKTSEEISIFTYQHDLSDGKAKRFILYTTKHMSNVNYRIFFFKSQNDSANYKWPNAGITWIAYYTKGQGSYVPGTFARVDERLVPTYGIDQAGINLLKFFGIENSVVPADPDTVDIDEM